MSEPKKPISHAKEPSPKPDVDKKAARKGGSHARKRKLRLDRIAAVGVPFLLIVLLIGALCFHSCQRRKSPEESGSTPVATATTSAEKLSDIFSYQVQQNFKLPVFRERRCSIFFHNLPNHGIDTFDRWSCKFHFDGDPFARHNTFFEWYT